MKWTVRFTRPSTEDIIDAIQRHKRDDPPRDQDFLNSIRQVVGHISEFPEAAALVSSKLFKRRDKVRELPCGPYRFIYLFRDDVCWVPAVIHGRRHLPKAWKERQRPIPPPEEPSY